jgi:hypothetical protein
VSPRVLQFQTCHMALGILWPQANGKYSVGPLTWLGPPTSVACPCVPEMPDIRLIMTTPGSALNAYKKAIHDVWVALNAYNTLTQQDGGSTVQACRSHTTGR